MLKTCLWFDGQAEEAATFYTTILRDGRIGEAARYGVESAQASGQPEGSVMMIEFEVEGSAFLALNGGPEFTFSEAVSFMIQRDTQEEIDEVWDALVDGGEPGQCGWLKDRFGVSWQVVPTALREVLGGDDAEGSRRPMTAMLQMRKLDIDELRRSYAGESATA